MQFAILIEQIDLAIDGLFAGGNSVTGAGILVIGLTGSCGIESIHDLLTGCIEYCILAVVRHGDLVLRQYAIRFGFGPVTFSVPVQPAALHFYAGFIKSIHLIADGYNALSRGSADIIVCIPFGIRVPAILRNAGQSRIGLRLLNRL